MEMYSIAVAVNLYHIGTQNLALVLNIFVFLITQGNSCIVIKEQRY